MITYIHIMYKYVITYINIMYKYVISISNSGET